MARLAFMGLGRMGFGMASRLLEAGHQLKVFNRTADRAQPLVSRGAQRCATPREACDGADGVFSMVADDAASRALWLGVDGALAATPASQAFAIECSTLSHAWVMELAGLCAPRGWRYVDAPVTGLPDAAAAGALTLLVGASKADLEAARGLFAPLAPRVIHFGPVGAGTAYKLIINLMGAVQIASAAEGLAIAERAGLDLAVVADAMAGSQAASPQVVRNTRRMVDGDHSTRIAFTAALRLKDVDYALRLARALAVASPFGQVAEEAYRAVCQMGHGLANESQVIDACRGRGVDSPP